MATSLSKKLVKFAKSKGYGDSMADSKFGKVSEYIETDSFSINLMLTAGVDKGIPIGKTVMFAGPTSSGKTQLALSTIKRAQLMGYTIVYWDSEFAAEESIFKSIEAELGDIVHMPMAELDIIKTAFVNMDKEIEEGEKVLHIFDSMGAWITNKTLNDAETGKEAKDMTIPGAKKELMTLINQACGKKHMGAIIINHSYANIGGYGAATTVSGGGALYMPSVILEFTSKARWKNSAGDPIGNVFTTSVKKSRLSKEGTKGHFAMSNKLGIAKYFGLMELAIEGGYVIKGRGGHGGKKLAYLRQYEINAVGEESATKFLDSDWEDLWYKDDFFGPLLDTKNTDFGEYLRKAHAYGY